MSGLRTADCVLRVAFAISLFGTAGCKADDDPTAWEIIRGTAALAASAAVVPDTRVPLASYPSRTGSLTIGEDSSVTGWIRLAVGDTAFVTGTVAAEGGDLLMTLTGLTPGEYTIITDGAFPDTYGLLSTTILNSDVTGTADPELHRIYWQFER